MAKLQDLVSPEEVLEAIRGGALKHEVIKKYKTSDQELAKLLLPLYRGGDLTKEEFNDFFKGVPLRPRMEPAGLETQEVVRLATEDEPPSVIVRTLSAQPVPVPAEEYAPEPEEAVEEQEVIEEPAVAEEISWAGEPEPKVAEQIVEEEPLPEMTSVQEPAIAATEAVEPSPEQVPAVAVGQLNTLLDSAGMSSILELMFAKLRSIDNRLAAIEKKLDGVGQ